MTVRRKYSSVVWWNNNGYNRWYCVWLTWFIQTSLNIYFSLLFISLQPEPYQLVMVPIPLVMVTFKDEHVLKYWMLRMLKEGINYFEVPAHSYNETQSEFEIVSLLSCVELFMHSGGLSTVPRMCRRKLQLWSYPYAYGFKRFIFKPFKSLFQLCDQEFFQFQTKVHALPLYFILF